MELLVNKKMTIGLVNNDGEIQEVKEFRFTAKTNGNGEFICSFVEENDEMDNQFQQQSKK